MNKQSLEIGIKIIFSLILLFISFFTYPRRSYAGTEFFLSSKRDKVIERTLNNLTERNKVIEETLRKITIEVALEYIFATQGGQTFELVDSQGKMVSKLTYPIKGQMVILRGEVGFLSKFFLGTRFGSSDFKKRVSSDEDWNFWAWHNAEWKYINYQISKQDSKSKVELFDVNLYYRFLDWDQEAIKEKRLLRWVDEVFDFLRLEKAKEVTLDVFAGYQSQKGRYNMVDPMREIWRIVDDAWWYAVGYPADIGLNSFYKIHYKGPRLGLRAECSTGKLTTKFCFAYAWLKTEAHGWWNLRNLAYWQKGKNGYGMEIGWEMSYPFTPWLSAGLGFNYLLYRQENLKMYAVEAGTPWWEGYQDRVRNADSEIYGPSFILKFIW